MPKFAANLTMLYTEVDFLDRFAAAAKAGFKGVEYLFPYDFDKDVLAERLKANGLTQVLHNLPAGNWGAGEARASPFCPTASPSSRKGSAAPSSTRPRSVASRSTAWPASSRRT